jgi:hypothetical protein
MKKASLKPAKNFHTSSSQKGMGDFYGQGVKNPIMKPKDIMGMKPLSSKKVKTAPRSMA